MLGLPGSCVREPLTRMADEDRAELRGVLVQIGVLP